MRRSWIVSQLLALVLVMGPGMLAGCRDRENDRSAEASERAAEEAEGSARDRDADRDAGDAREDDAAGYDEGSDPADRDERDRAPAAITRTIVVPAGTQIVASLQERLSTETGRSGQTFTAVTRESIREGGTELIPAGSTVRGAVAGVERAPRVGGSAEMSLEFREVVTPSGVSHAIAAAPLNLTGKSSTKGDIEKVLGGAVGGGIIGGVLGGKKGAGRGAAGGVVVGGVIAVATRGQDIVLNAGTDLAVTLTGDLPIQITTSRQDLP